MSQPPQSNSSIVKDGIVTLNWNKSESEMSDWDSDANEDLCVDAQNQTIETNQTDENFQRNISRRGRVNDESEDEGPPKVPLFLPSRKHVNHTIFVESSGAKRRRKRGRKNKHLNTRRTQRVEDNSPAVEEPEEKMQLERETSAKKPPKARLRSPICVVMGHVDAGKTKLLDQIRCTNVQGHEAGGITQQIGATFVSIENIKNRTELLRQEKTFEKIKYKVPGLLFVDTPGHASFSNLRHRGSSMCDVAVLVVNILEGLKPQTKESLAILKHHQVDVIVAVNQIDRLNNWNPFENATFKTTFAQQNKPAKRHFDRQMDRLRVEFAEEGFNVSMYDRHRRKTLVMVPISAVTGEGIPDLLVTLAAFTQKFRRDQLELSLSAADFRCTILEVKQSEGLGTTLDVIVSNGTLEASDSIILCGRNGPIETKIRALLVPPESTEMRVQGQFAVVHRVEAAAGVRISCTEDMSMAVAGTSVMLVPREHTRRQREFVNELRYEVQHEYDEMMRGIADRNCEYGVYVHASTMGSLEALVSFMDDMRVPVRGLSIGDIRKKDVMKAAVIRRTHPEFGVILAFNVGIDGKAEAMANEEGVQIFSDQIIFHLFDRFSAYIDEVRQTQLRNLLERAVIPCELTIEDVLYSGRDSLMMVCRVTRGSLRIGTPLVAKKRRKESDGSERMADVFLGRVTCIRDDTGADRDRADSGKVVSVRLVDEEYGNSPAVFGKHFDKTCLVVSRVTRESRQALKEFKRLRDEFKRGRKTS